MANYKIDHVEGIGPAFADKLRGIGIKSVAALLAKGATPKGRKEIVEKTGISDSLVLKWVNMADLYRVAGVGSEYAELLEAAGVDTVKELRNRNAENLWTKMQDVNASKKLVRQLPSLKMVQSWVSHAKTLNPVVTY
ncbi:MAG: DUF4332 domain-containing protein [Calditrichaeota bacterium]|nr:DUF4332 domain-containing protein [Calditrichota bacterium]